MRPIDPKASEHSVPLTITAPDGTPLVGLNFPVVYTYPETRLDEKTKEAMIKAMQNCRIGLPEMMTVKFRDDSEESVALLLQRGYASRDPVVAAFLVEWRHAPHSDITLTYILAKCIEALVEQKTAIQTQLIDVLEKMPSVVQTPLANADKVLIDSVSIDPNAKEQHRPTITLHPLTTIQAAVADEQQRIMAILQDLLDRADSAAVRETLRLAVRRIVE